MPAHVFLAKYAKLMFFEPLMYFEPLAFGEPVISPKEFP